MDFLIDDENINSDYETENLMLFNKDCLDILVAIPENSIDCIVSDPPYRLTRRGGGKRKEGKKYCGGIFDIKNKDEETIKNIRNGKLFKHNDISFKEWMPLLYKVLKERRTLLSYEQLPKLRYNATSRKVCGIYSL